MAKQLPGNITSYDLFKAFALISMVVDHVGWYFFPDQNWFRVFGRLCVPIWFFLVGYAQSRDIGPRMWIGGAILVLANYLCGIGLFPLNVLFSMLFVRLTIDRAMPYFRANADSMIFILMTLFILAMPTNSIFEYGTQGLLLSMYGFILRNRTAVGGLAGPVSTGRVFALFTLTQFVLIQGIFFFFNLPQTIALTFGITFVLAALYRFKPAEFPQLTQRLPRALTALIQFLGRRTLEIYVVHLCLFKVLAVLLHTHDFQPLHLVWLE